MENTMNASDTIGTLAGALAKAQTEYLPLHKESDNPYYESKYADLAAVIKATQQALAKNGLVVIQSPIVDTENEKAGVITILAHSSGEWLSNELLLPATMKGKRNKQTGEESPVRFDAQSVGSAISYSRRYSYQAVVGVAADVDDDGNAASDSQRERGVAAAQSVATEKLKQAAKGNETVTITPYKEGFVALSGPGLPIVRANLDNKTMADLGWKWEGKVALIPAGKAFNFVDLCEKHKVGTVLMDAGGAKEAENPNAAPKATLPPFIPPSGFKSGDPLIISANRVKSRKPGGKEYLSVNWDGKTGSCFDKKYWPHLEHYVNRPAVLVLETKGQYTNVVGIESLDGEFFESERV